MNGDVEHEYLEFAQRAYGRLRGLDVKIAKQIGQRKFTLFLPNTALGQCHRYLQDLLKILDTNKNQKNPYLILKALTHTALKVKKIAPTTLLTHDPYTDISRLCDQTASKIMHAYQCESPLMRLPPQLIHMIDASVASAENRAILKDTAKIFSEIVYSNEHEHAYNYRANALMAGQAGNLFSDVPDAERTTFHFMKTDDMLLYTQPAQAGNPGRVYLKPDNAPPQPLSDHDNIAMIGDRFVFLSSPRHHEIMIAEMQNKYWEKIGAIPYPEELKNHNVKQLHPLSKHLIVVTFDTGDCYLLDSRKSQDPWHYFYHHEGPSEQLESYGTHECPLLLMHTADGVLIFDINSLIERDTPKINELPNPDTITCLTTIGDGILATGHHDGSILLWKFHDKYDQAQLIDNVAIRGLLGYDDTYIPEHLCHLEDDNIAIHLYSGAHQDGTIMVLDPHDDHFVGKVAQHIIEEVDFLRAIPNGDLLVGNQHQLVTWSPRRREQLVYKCENSIEECHIISPDKVIVIDKDYRMQELRFPTHAQLKLEEQEVKQSRTLRRMMGSGG